MKGLNLCLTNIIMQFELRNCLELYKEFNECFKTKIRPENLKERQAQKGLKNVPA